MREPALPTRTTRLAVLLVALGVAAAWAFGRTQLRRARTTWAQPVAIAILVLDDAPAPPGPQAMDWLRASTDALAEQLSRERRRHDPAATGPAFSVEVLGPLRPSRLPPRDPPGPGLLERARHAIALSRATRAAHEAAEALDPAFDPGAYDVRIYLVAAEDALHFAEGFGEAGGEVGVVRATLRGDGLLAATAALHEAFHALGATDKYDEAGHAVAPGGLVEPGLVPPYPQRQAELMVGEVPLAPGRGRLPERPDEIGVGPATAAEVGWTRPGGAPPP